MGDRRKRKKKKGSGSSRRRRIALVAGSALLAVLATLCVAGEWFVHHPRAWVTEKCGTLPKIFTAPLLFFGNPVADITDALDWTGYDTVCEYDTEAPAGSVSFAGTPRRVSAPAPADIRVIDRGEFIIGWSDSLRHPVWCAYHVTRSPVHESNRRANFTKDRSLPASPSPDDYRNSGFDRGHMVPNHAIVTRFGEDAQRMTYMMSNISPQTPSLNRGVWRDFEHRIADLWTARYGEIWVVVGCISSVANRETVSGSNIDVPKAYYQIVIAQEGMDVRSLAVLFPQNVPWRAWAARNIVTIRELEERTGLDFNPELPSFIRDPLETDLPSRLWPIRAVDIFKQIAIRYR